MRTKIKICGLKSLTDCDYVIENNVEYAGMVLFFEKSHRNLEIQKAEEMLKYIKEKSSGKIKVVAVTVSPTIIQLKKIEDAGFDFIQIHGELDKEVLENAKIKIIRAFNVKNMDEWKEYMENDKVEAFLFDSAKPGSGKVFDWNEMSDIKNEIKSKCKKTFFLAGGIDVNNAKEAIKALEPDVLDVSTGVELLDKSGKDREKIKKFVEVVRS